LNPEGFLLAAFSHQHKPPYGGGFAVTSANLQVGTAGDFLFASVRKQATEDNGKNIQHADGTLVGGEGLGGALFNHFF